MAVPESTVLHVLPHPGGGGETYVYALGQMEGYSFERMYLAPTSTPAGVRAAIVRRSVQVQRVAMKYDVVHVVGEVASLLCLPTLAARPSVVSPQGLHLVRRLDGPAKTAAEMGLRSIVRCASRTVCSSEDEQADVLRVVGRRSASRVLLIRNGVSVDDPVEPAERAAARAELELGAGDVAGVWLASLHEHKDPVTPIRAAQEVRRGGAPLVLLLAGDGPMRQRVEEVACESDAGAMRVLGFRSDVRRVLAAADFFVLSSQREGLSFSLLEAMALGLPAVVSNAPANAEAVDDAGIVVPFGDVTRFAEAFARIVGNSQERLALGERARSRVVRHFCVEDMIRRTRELYDEVAQPA